MIKSKNETSDRGIEIDLTGPDGNAYALMAYASRFCRQMEIDSKPVIADMMSGNYEHLLEVFEKHFGSFVTLYR